MPLSLSMQSRREVIQHLAPRYQQAPRAQKTRLLNECVSITEYTRKYALRLLNHPEEARLQGQRACLYGEAVLNALLAAWTAANHICAKRLMPFLPTFLEALERHGHLHLGQEHRDQLLTMSVSTADRFLRAQPKPQPRGLSCTKAGIPLKHQIPIRTFREWDGAQPGFLEAERARALRQAHRGWVSLYPDPDGCGDRLDGVPPALVPRIWGSAGCPATGADLVSLSNSRG